jgi:hypothetical protein
MKFTAALVLFASLPCLSARAQDYEIHLDRPQRAGDKYQISTTGRLTGYSVLTRDGKVERTNNVDLKVDLEGVVTVLAVSNGASIKHSISVRRLNRTEYGRMSILAGSGTTIVASLDRGKRSYTLNGGNLGPKDREAVSLVADLKRPGFSDDALFGTRERKKVGDTWSANARLLAQALNEDETLQMENVSGNATLKEVVTESDGPVLIIAAEASGRPVPGFLRDVKVNKAEMSYKATGHVPVDTARGRPEDVEEMNVIVDAKGKASLGGPEVELKMNVTQSVTTRRTPAR